MVSSSPEHSDPTPPEEPGEAWWVLPALLVVMSLLLILRVLLGPSEKADPMSGIDHLEVRGLHNQSYLDLEIEPGRISSDPFGEMSEARSSISCHIQAEDPDRFFGGEKLIRIPRQYLVGLSQKGESFRIEPFSLRWEWTQGIEFRSIQQVFCTFVIPIKGGQNAALILEMRDLKFVLDPHTSLVNVYRSDSERKEISVPGTIRSILSGAQFALVVTGDKQGRQYGDIESLRSR